MIQNIRDKQYAYKLFCIKCGDFICMKSSTEYFYAFCENCTIERKLIDFVKYDREKIYCSICEKEICLKNNPSYVYAVCNNCIKEVYDYEL